MSAFEKLKFWKKEPEELPKSDMPSFVNPLGSDRLPIGEGPQTDGFSAREPYSGPSFPSPMPRPALTPAQPPDKDFQIISAKLDTIKATLDDINHRLARLEKIANEETEQIRWR